MRFILDSLHIPPCANWSQPKMVTHIPLPKQAHNCFSWFWKTGKKWHHAMHHFDYWTVLDPKLKSLFSYFCKTELWELEHCVENSLPNLLLLWKVAGRTKVYSILCNTLKIVLHLLFWCLGKLICKFVFGKRYKGGLMVTENDPVFTNSHNPLPDF